MTFKKGSPNRPVGFGKIGIVVVGMIALGLGLYSHFQSSWTKSYTVTFGTDVPAQMQLYEICNAEYWDIIKPQIPGDGATCPPIIMEQVFIGVIIFSFLLSLGSLALFVLMDAKSRGSRFMDIGYHWTSSGLLIVAAALYLVSTEQVKELVGRLRIYESKISVDFLRTEKIAAGALTILLGVMHGVVGCLVQCFGVMDASDHSSGMNTFQK